MLLPLASDCSAGPSALCSAAIYRHIAPRYSRCMIGLISFPKADGAQIFHNGTQNDGVKDSNGISISESACVLCPIARASAPTTLAGASHGRVREGYLSQAIAGYCPLIVGPNEHSLSGQA